MTDAPIRWETPLCLVDNVSEGEFKVVDKTIQQLRAVQHPVVVVSIVGPYRSGKSYLMNRLAGHRKGFDIGNTVQAKTKGIWVWCLPHPVKSDHQLLLLDTEGLGDVEKITGSKNDIMLFLLTTLFSSCLIYNSKGTIDQPAIDHLRFVSEIAEKFKISSDSDSAEDEDIILGQYFPQFIWVVRDFTLELKINGEDVTADQYLENALTLKKGSGAKATEYNLPRKCIRRYFPDRKCFVFPTPVSDTKQLSNLPDLTASQLEVPFLQKTKQLIDHVMLTVKPKGIGGIVFDGPKFISLVRRFTVAIATGKIPSVEAVVTETAAEVNTAVISDCVNNYRVAMGNLTLPSIDEKSLMSHHENCVATVKDELKRRGINLDKDESKVIDQLMADINKEFEDVRKKDSDASLDKCREIIKGLFSDIDKNLDADNNIYYKAGGYSQYQKDFGEACMKYLNTPNKGVMATQALQECVAKFSPLAKAIMTFDKQLTETFRKQEEQKLKEQEEALEKEKLKKIQEQIQKQLEEEKHRRADFERAMKEMFADQQTRHTQNMLRLHKQLSREHERLKREGATEDCEALADLLEELEKYETTQQQQQQQQEQQQKQKAPLYFIHRP